MSVELLDLGTQIAAIAVIIVGIGLVAIGRASWLGYTFRSSIEPALSRFRQDSELSRAELANRWMLVAFGMAILDGVVRRNAFAVVLGMLLWLSRPAVIRLTREEHPLLALPDSLAIDLMIGMYLPIAISQLLLRHVLLGGSFAALILALSWPAGGGATGRRFQFATLS